MAEDKPAAGSPDASTPITTTGAATATAPPIDPATLPEGALPQTDPVDPDSLVLITNPNLEGGAVTTVPRRAYEDLWQHKGFVIVEDDTDVVAVPTGQTFLKDEARNKYPTTDVTHDGVRTATADIANTTVVTPGEAWAGTGK